MNHGKSKLPSTGLLTNGPIHHGKAKETRQRFRNMITEISEIISNRRLSTNQILAKAIAIMSLGKFSENHFGRKVSHQEESLVDKNFQFAFNISEVLHAFNSIGVGISSDGKIIYVSENLQEQFEAKLSLLGDHVSTLISQSNEFMYQVFHNRHSTVLCSLITKSSVNTVKCCSKFIFKGELLSDGNGNELYLAVAECVTKPPRGVLPIFDVQELMMNESFSLISSNDTYMERLLGFETKHNNFLNYVVDDDLFSCFTNLKTDLSKFGHKKTVFRHYCADGCILFVHTNIFLIEKDDGSWLLVFYCTPFAFGVADCNFISDIVDQGMRMFDSSDVWLAQLPYFNQL